jgi:hypothetical protein
MAPSRIKKYRRFSAIAKFLLEKARNKADALWERKGYTDEKLQEILNAK